MEVIESEFIIMGPRKTWVLRSLVNFTDNTDFAFKAGAGKSILWYDFITISSGAKTYAIGQFHNHREQL